MRTGMAFFAKLPQQKISQVVQLLLLVYIAWLLAQLSWKLMPQPEIKAVTVSSAGTSSNGAVVADISKITSLNLFGDYNKKPEQIIEQKVEDAPETRLALKLTGVVPSTNPQRAAAIIEKSGRQDVYGIDEKIDGTRAIIREIYADRIILEQSGRRETLMLEGRDYNAIASEKPNTDNTKQVVKPQPQKNVVNGEAKKEIDNLREQAFKDPGKLVDYLKVSPVRRDNRLVGYRLYPGKKPEVFRSVGLKAGDIAVEINGYDLTNLSQAMQAMTQLKDAQEATIMVERDNALQQIFISLY